MDRQVVDEAALEASVADYLVKDQIDVPAHEPAIRHAIERTKEETTLHSHAKQLAVLQQVELELAAQLDLDALLHSIISHAVELVGGTIGSLYLHKPNQGVLVPVVSVGGKPTNFVPVIRPGEGFTGKAWQTGAPIIVDDYPRWAGRLTDYEDPDFRSAIGVPIRWGPAGKDEKFLGVLNIVADTPGAFSAADADLLTLLANQAAVAIENARLYDEARRRNRELALLNRVMAISAASQDVKTILETVCCELALAFDVPQAAAALLNESKTQARVVAEYRAEDRPSALGTIIPVEGNPSFRYLLTHRAPLVVNDAQTDPRLAPIHDIQRRRGTVSLLILPLVIDGEVVGSLGVDAIERRVSSTGAAWPGPGQPEQGFSADEVALAQRVADQVAGALDRARMAETQRRLSTAVEGAAECVIITDLSGTILYVNPAFERITGYTRAEAIGQNPRILKSGKQDDAFYRDLWLCITAGHVWRGRLVNRKKDGTLYTEDATITPVRDQAGQNINYVAVKHDVSRELQLEAQFQQAQKMEALGRLAGGVAHDFNNVLTVVNLSTRLLERMLTSEHPAWRHVQRIQDAEQRATGLTRQLLSFSRQELVRPHMLNLNDAISELSKMLRRIIGDDVELMLHLAPDPWPIKADPTQTDQVLMNLAVNARDAMPQGGILTIETANAVLDADYVAQHVGTEPGEYVMLTISDTGVGMDDAVKARIFEPFFTTKESGKGTGLGLATVFGIVKQSGGHIWVYSEVGQGTTFKIYLPRADGPAEKPVTTTEEGEAAHNNGSGKTILVVEDRKELREITAQILREQGYQALVAEHGAAALELSERHEGPIDLLLTDMVMPGMNGKDLAQRIGNQRPNTRILYMSGYTDSAVVNRGALRADDSFLSKPFSAERLTQKVREVLQHKV